MEQINAKQIEEWLEAHRAEMVEDIFRIVRIPSVSDAASPVKPYGQPCRDVLDEMLNIAREHGFHTRNFDYQCGCMWLGEEKSTCLTPLRSGGIWMWCRPAESGTFPRLIRSSGTGF